MKYLLTFIFAISVVAALPVGVESAWAEQADKNAEAAQDTAQDKAEQVKEDGEEEPEDQEKKSLNKALGKFYIALNTLFRGDVKPMKKVWSHADDVTYMPPDGTYLVGWEEVEKSWEAQADLELGGVVKPEDINYNIGETIAVVHNYEVGENFTDGEVDEVKIRVTNLFRKEDGEWKMIGHHTDILPFLKKDLKEDGK